MPLFESRRQRRIVLAVVLLWLVAMGVAYFFFACPFSAASTCHGMP
jgi:hypothetical protein